MSDYVQLLQGLRQLVGFETVTGNHAQVGSCYDSIVSQIQSPRLYINRYSSNGYESLVISTQDTKHPKVLLQSHIDVVPAYPEQFQLVQKEGKLFGRGVYDMKYAAACFVHLLEDMGPAAQQYDFAVMLTADEEVNGLNGVDYLLNQGYGADVCILPDSGDEWNIEASSKGFATAEILVSGKSAHGSRPWEGDNAAVKLVDILTLLGEQFPYTAPLDTTCTLTRFDAGPAYNQIPGEATATFDIRYPDEASYASFKKHFQAFCEKHTVKAVFTAQAAAIQHDVDSPLLEVWQSVTEQITGKAPGYTHSFAASDARYLVPRGITTISARPKGGGHHGPNEWISEKEFYQYYEVVKKFVTIVAAVDLDSKYTHEPGNRSVQVDA
ncbi:MAG TPA: M20/M25/M40 family metallo-hydrolase [Candidatus Saccharimonadales bacterium]|jgi:acetylornithine deacetylase/succinyl-diaminopimelate desuccinylase-like protein